MTPQEKKDILTAYLRLKTEEGSWQEVIGAASDLKGVEAVLKAIPLPLPLTQPQPTPPEPTSRIIEASESAGEVPVKEMPIPHNISKTKELLSLSDYDLVDRLFPDYSQPQK